MYTSVFTEGTAASGALVVRAGLADRQRRLQADLILSAFQPLIQEHLLSWVMQACPCLPAVRLEVVREINIKCGGPGVSLMLLIDAQLSVLCCVFSIPGMRCLDGPRMSYSEVSRAVKHVLQRCTILEVSVAICTLCPHAIEASRHSYQALDVGRRRSRSRASSTGHINSIYAKCSIMVEVEAYIRVDFGVLGMTQKLTSVN